MNQWAKPAFRKLVLKPVACHASLPAVIPEEEELCPHHLKPNPASLPMIGSTVPMSALECCSLCSSEGGSTQPRRRITKSLARRLVNCCEQHFRFETQLLHFRSWLRPLRFVVPPQRFQQSSTVRLHSFCRSVSGLPVHHRYPSTHRHRSLVSAA